MWSDSEGSCALRAAPPPPGAPAAPRIDRLTVCDHSRVHIGPKFVSVTQNVQSAELIRGGALGVVLQEEGGGGGGGGGGRRMRCSVAVFVCWALALAGALACYAARLALAPRAARLDLALAEPWYLRRADWQAMPPYGASYLALPVRRALVGHSATPRCEGRYNCTRELLEIQREHQRRGWDDIGPNFLVSADGLVFEGRGANVQGAMVRGWNARGVSLMFLGDYRRGRDAPSAAALQRAAALLAALVAAGALHERYALAAHCQLVPHVYSPGQELLARLDRFPHWDRANLTGCLDW